MATLIDRDAVRRLVEDGAVLMEVLALKEYERAHLPGAIHIPLKALGPQTTAQFKKDAPIITYCFDYQ